MTGTDYHKHNPYSNGWAEETFIIQGRNQDLSKGGSHNVSIFVKVWVVSVIVKQ